MTKIIEEIIYSIDIKDFLLGCFLICLCLLFSVYFWDIPLDINIYKKTIMFFKEITLLQSALIVFVINILGHFISFFLESIYSFMSEIISFVNRVRGKKNSNSLILETKLFNKLKDENIIRDIKEKDYKYFIIQKYLEEYIYNKDFKIYRRFKKEWEKIKFYRTIITLLLTFIVYGIGLDIFIKIASLSAFYYGLPLFLIIVLCTTYVSYRIYKDKADMILLVFLETINISETKKEKDL
ncbi:hypothetical protein CRV08_02720 [Halarcobacter ebronensis]|uniref:Uncharacterized protein n=1 Tax=Halarcobacter ebronensis TaxID=1462615 RepID=A0A4Q0YG74_9BACT|nr:hypothetical protein [Halarcobacter ebronensis]RXJ69636.1 hypothetical protein CRV08_02720 [Halarcobacter ebronensis]